MSCENFEELSNWIALLKTSSVNGTLDSKPSEVVNNNAAAAGAGSKTTKLSRAEKKEQRRIDKENKNKIIVNVTLNNVLLSCCPFSPEISAKKALEARMRRRSSVKELEERNIIHTDGKNFQSKRQTIMNFLHSDHSNSAKRRASAANALAFSLDKSSAEIDVNKGFGWLNKKGHMRHNWKKRFFILTTKLVDESENYRLLYFAKAIADPLDDLKWKKQEKFSKGAVYLAGAKVEVVKGKETHKNFDVMNEFQVAQADGSVYEFYANSREERDEWIEDIESAIEEATKRDANMVKQKKINESPEKLSDEMFKLIDTDGDGKLSDIEIAAANKVLIDIPAPWATADEVKVIGLKQRRILSQVLRKLLATLEDENDRVGGKVRPAWGVETSHKNLRIIMSTVALTKSPLRNPVCMCVQRILEIERPIKDMYFNNEFVVEDLSGSSVEAEEEGE